MKNFKWGTRSFSDEPIYVVLFVSRNKDNKDVEGFVERRKSFITHKDISLDEAFKHFVDNGVIGEMSRMYVSVNERDGQKIYQSLLHFLIDNPDFNLCDIQPKLAGIAAQKECAKTKHWLFDFDNDDNETLQKFVKDIKEIDETIMTTVYKTPHGYAVITDKGFDCRKKKKKYDFVTLKRDDLVCVKWEKKLV